MFRLVVAPDCCGRKVVRSVALRMPSFSMSAGRYVSTGFGPVSCAVGMFEPVTITRSISVTPDAVVSWANAFGAKTVRPPTLAMRATRRHFPSNEAFISDPSWPDESDYTDFCGNLQCQSLAETPEVLTLNAGRVGRAYTI